MAETLRERLIREYAHLDESDLEILLHDCCADDYGYLDDTDEELQKKCARFENENRDLEQMRKKDQIQIATLKDQLEQERKHNVTLEHHLERYRLVVKCIEAFTGEKLNIERGASGVLNDDYY